MILSLNCYLGRQQYEKYFSTGSRKHIYVILSEFTAEYNGFRKNMFVTSIENKIPSKREQRPGTK